MPGEPLPEGKIDPPIYIRVSCVIKNEKLSPY